MANPQTWNGGVYPHLVEHVNIIRRNRKESQQIQWLSFQKLYSTWDLWHCITWVLPYIPVIYTCNNKTGLAIVGPPVSTLRFVLCVGTLQEDPEKFHEGLSPAGPVNWLKPYRWPTKFSQNSTNGWVFIWRVVKMFVPGLVEIACSLARRFMFGLQNGDPTKLLHFTILFLKMIKIPQFLLAPSHVHSLSLALEELTSFICFQKEFRRFLAFSR